MRKSRFVGAIDQESLESARPTIQDALCFDVRSPQSGADGSLSSARVSTLDDAPIVLGGADTIVGLAVILNYPADADFLSVRNPALWIGILLLFDTLAGLAARWRDELMIPTHALFRCFCGYVVARAVLWLPVGAALFNTNGYHSVAPLALAATMTAGAVLSLRSPAFAVVNLLLASVAAILFSQTVVIAAGVILLFFVMLAFSVRDAQSVILAGRRRIALDAEAHKAVHFVDEFENSGRGWFWETNTEGTLSYVSRQLADDFECEPEQLLGRRFTDLVSVDSRADSVGEAPKTLGFHLSARFGFSDVVVRAASDKGIYWSLSGNPVFDELGHFHGFRGIGTDLTEQRRTEQEISRLARFDSLTGLHNREMMRQTLDQALRNSFHRRKGCALFLIDLDRFKNVNDTLGHPIGDALLREVAERLKSVMGDYGQVGRLGGDEFKAVLPGIVDIGTLEALARTLIAHVSRPYMIEGHKIVIGASVGIAIGDPGRCTVDSLVRDADLALYAAKADGRGKHKLYEPSMHSEASDRQLLENELRQAIDRGELWVAYQPIVRAAGEELCGFEALVRWNHPVHGSISPAKFIPIAEECGIISRIGMWVLDTAVAEAARWPANIRIAVNLSPIQFNDPAIIQVVDAALKRNGFAGERLELEITEGVFLGESDATDDTFARLKSLGVRLALDDFGTGYSSLGYLKKAPFDKIKIDQSFVRGASSTASRNSAIIRAIVTLAESLDVDTCAEGVETHDDLHLIRELGCSQIQGYIFGGPVTAEEARKLASGTSIEADGYKCIRAPRQRLMRRGIALIDQERVEIRLRNISGMGALIECSRPVMPGSVLTVDIIGVGPVVATVRWSQSGKFGVQFNEPFDLSRLAPRKTAVKEARPWYVEPRQVG